MPFKRNDLNAKDDRSQPNNQRIFVGRTDELLFFIQNILKPKEPTHNIISIYGQGGVGKSTLITQFIEEANATNFKGQCLTATVNERQTTPLAMMEELADQLRRFGYPLKKFEDALNLYKSALRRLQAKQEERQEILLRGTMEVVESVAEDVPFLGGMLQKGSKTLTEHLLEKEQTRRILGDFERLENPIKDLTRAFVESINNITNIKVSLGVKIKQNRRLILFFDTFELLALEATPWLIDHFLENDINSNVVIVVAGRDPIERSTLDDPKRWLPYLDNKVIHSISLDCFTFDETSTYLTKQGISDPIQIETIWKLSHGLPLYLCLLTSNPQGKIDPTADVVANFLRWIPKQEQVKRRLVLDAALLSISFNLDDMSAFTYLSESERPSLYHWLISQPFVKRSSQDGRYIYHELAQELFSRHLYQRSRNECQATRRMLVNHYQGLLDKNCSEGVKEIYDLDECFEIVLAFIYQLFLLSNETSHMKAIEQILLYWDKLGERHGEIIRLLRDICKEHPNNQANTNARRTIKYLLQYFEADLKGKQFLEAADYLVEKVKSNSSFSQKLLSNIYSNRGIVYWNLQEYEQAIAEYEHALEINSNNVWAYAGRGNCFRRLNSYKQAIQDYDQAVTLDPNLALAYAGRGETYHLLKEYRQAIADYNRALVLKPNYTRVLVRKGRSHYSLKEYHQAIEAFNQALAHNPKEAPDYLQRGLAYLCLKNLQQAKADFIRGRELSPTIINYAWMTEWVKMCQDGIDTETEKQLERLLTIESESYEAYVCQGVVLFLRGIYEKALTVFDHASHLVLEEWDAYFWKGMVLASLNRDKEAVLAIERALEVGLPPILLIPLNWLKEERKDLYENYVLPLLTHYSLMNQI